MRQAIADIAVVGKPTGAARVCDAFWPIAGGLFLLRLFLDSHCNLVPDEAFYWTWTRHLATGYFDHPPMIAWMMWLSTQLMGNTELGVRLPASVLSIASLAVLYSMARQILHDRRAVGFVLLMWICGPLLPVIGTIVTPDAPVTFFSVCALAFAARIAAHDDAADPAAPLSFTAGAKEWMAFGACCGLALLSKYTTVLLPAGVALAFLTSRRGVRHYARPWIYLSGFIALVVFSPCVYWNYRHQWASFAFQLHHGAGSGLTDGVVGAGSRLLARSKGLGQFVGGQAVVWTPILFGVSIFVLACNWTGAFSGPSHHGANGNRTTPGAFRRLVDAGKLQRLASVHWLLLWSGTLPLLFFGFMAMRSHGEINWPAFAYFPISLLMGRYLSENWTGNRVQWTSLGCKVALAFTVVVHLVAMYPVQKALMKHMHLTHQITDLYGWNDYGRNVFLAASGRQVVCNRHQDAGEAAFYMPGQPQVWCDGVGSRPTAFDYFDTNRLDLANEREVAFVGGHVEQFNRKWGFHTVEVRSFLMPGLGRNRSHTVTIVAR